MKSVMYANFPWEKNGKQPKKKKIFWKAQYKIFCIDKIKTEENCTFFLCMHSLEPKPESKSVNKDVKHKRNCCKLNHFFSCTEEASHNYFYSLTVVMSLLYISCRKTELPGGSEKMSKSAPVTVFLSKNTQISHEGYIHFLFSKQEWH